MIPERLRQGDSIRVIAPSWSMSIIDQEVIKSAEAGLNSLGFSVTYGAHVAEENDFRSTAVAARVDDIHQAFADPSVKGILTVIGGWNVNQLFDHLDWDLIKNNPKVFAGFSDIDALSNAIYSQTGLITYSAPLFIFFGQKKHNQYTKEYFQKAVMSSEPFNLRASSHFSDDEWYQDQGKRNWLPSKGWQVIQEGEAEGLMISSNLSSLNILQGTKYMPDLNGVILFLEEAGLFNPMQFDRKLQSLVQTKDFNIRGLVLGRFQKGAMSDELLNRILSSKPQLRSIPIIANVDYGHTDPKMTLPIGGRVSLSADPKKPVIQILNH